MLLHNCYISNRCSVSEKIDVRRDTMVALKLAIDGMAIKRVWVNEIEMTYLIRDISIEAGPNGFMSARFVVAPVKIEVVSDGKNEEAT